MGKSAIDAMTRDEVVALFELGERERCLELSEVGKVVQSLDLDEEEVEALYEEIEEREIEIETIVGAWRSPRRPM